MMHRDTHILTLSHQVRPLSEVILQYILILTYEHKINSKHDGGLIHESIADVWLL